MAGIRDQRQIVQQSSFMPRHSSCARVVRQPFTVAVGAAQNVFWVDLL